MATYGHKSLIRLVCVLAFLLAAPIAFTADFQFVGCYAGAEPVGDPNASMNLWAVSPADFDTRLRMCLDFCTTGNAPAKADDIYTSQGGFPHRFVAYSTSNWCFCGGKIKGTPATPAGSGSNRCENTITVYQRSDGTQPPTSTNQRPRAPTVNPGGWDPPFPVSLEGAIQLTWQNNGDPDGDPVTFWIEIWWWNAQQNNWVLLTAEWANEGYFTLTTARGLVPDIYYAWRVAAVDSLHRSNPWFSYSTISAFKTIR